MQYVEMVSSRRPTQAGYQKTRMFVSPDDYRKLEQIINITDNKSNQCKTNKRACLEEADSFTHLVDFYYIREEYKAGGVPETVWEGEYRRGERHGLSRYSSLAYGQSSLTWYDHGDLNGKYFLSYLSYDTCYKLIYSAGQLRGSYVGSDMRKPF